MIQSNYIYLVSFLFGISLFDVMSIRSSRFSFLTTASNTLKDSSMNCIRRGSQNSLRVNNYIRGFPTRSLISPILATMLFPLSSTLAEAVENGNVIVSSPSVSSCAYPSITPSAAFLLTNNELDTFLTIGGLVFCVFSIYAAILAFFQLAPYFMLYGFRGLETSVIKLQIGLDAENWSDCDTTIETETLSDFTRPTMGKLLSEGAMKLLRRQADWNSATLDSRVFRSYSAAELEFHRLSLAEQSKLQRDEGRMVLGDGQQKRSQQQQQQQRQLSSPVAMSKPRGGSELVVVTLLVMIRGRSGTYRGLTGILPLDRPFSTRNMAEVRQSLLALASEALLDSGKYMEFAEILWCR